jgi:hypothetical protein
MVVRNSSEPNHEQVTSLVIIFGISGIKSMNKIINRDSRLFQHPS